MDKIKEVYIVKFDDYVGMYIPGKCPTIGYEKREKWIDFVKSVIEAYPEFKPRCVLNDGIVEAVKKKIQADNIMRMYMGKSR